MGTQCLTKFGWLGALLRQVRQEYVSQQGMGMAGSDISGTSLDKRDCKKHRREKEMVVAKLLGYSLVEIRMDTGELVGVKLCV
jgi:hypothetical protein